MWRVRCLALSVVDVGLVCNHGGCAVVFKSYIDGKRTLAWTKVTCGSPMEPRLNAWQITPGKLLETTILIKSICLEFTEHGYLWQNHLICGC